MLTRHAQLTGHNGAIYALRPGLETGSFLSAGGDGWLVAWQYAEPELGRVIARIEGRIFSFLPLPEQRWIVAGDMNGGVHWIDLEQPDRTIGVAHHRKGVFGLALYRDQLLSLGGAGKLTRWSVAERRTLESLQLSGQSLRAIARHPQLPEAAIGASDGRIYIVDLEQFRLRHTIPAAHTNSVFCLQYSPDGKRLYSGGRDAHLRSWSTWEGYAPEHALPAHLYTVNHLTHSPDGRYLATAARDKTVKLWRADTLELLKVLDGVRDRGHFNSVNTLLWNEQGLFSAGDDRSILWWKSLE